MRYLRWLVVLLAIALVLAACGGADEEAPTEEPATEAPAEEEEPTGRKKGRGRGKGAAAVKSQGGDGEAPAAKPQFQSKLELLASLGYLMKELHESGERPIVLDDSMPFETAVNTACAGLPLESRVRQALLEENDLVNRRDRVAELIQELLATLLRLKARYAEPDGGMQN